MNVLVREAIPAALAGDGAARCAIAVREAVDADWVDAGRICYEAFACLADRHGFPHDFPTVAAASEPIRWLINHPHIYGVVAEADGKIVGSNFLDERGPISAIGPISVDPAAQDHGIGRLLMEAVLERARRQGAAAVRLLQIAYHNRSLSLYAKLGMDIRGSFAAMYGPPIGQHMPGYDVRSASAADEDACNALCVRVHGHPRPGEVRDALEAGSLKVVERLGRLTGYTTGINYFTHSVAETTDDMKALICDADDFGTPGYLVPLANGELFRWSLAHGLRIFFVLNMMSIGIYQEPAGAFMPSVGY